MNKSKWVKKLRKFHKWPGILISLFVILFALSGIVMNHRQMVSSIDVSRNLLPSNYSYKNWNQAAVKGSATLDGNSGLIYGNIGIWKTTDDFTTFSDFNQGFPKGVDGRKINAVVRFGKGWIVAGSQFGLFKRNLKFGVWEKMDLPVDNNRVSDLTTKDDTLIILTRDYLLKSFDLKNFQRIQLPEPINYQRKAGLFNTLWELHSGELFGPIGKLLVDVFGFVVIFLSLTGLFHFFFPKIISRRKRKEKPVIKLISAKRMNLRWHNVIGYVFALFLVINTISGMHLRPPLLIAISNKQIGIIPFTHLDTPNPWHDKLRRVVWDGQIGKFIYSTSDGFFYGDETFAKPLIPFNSQPPVSVMGCNVLEKISNGKYLIGSFSGMFVWDIYNQTVYDYSSGQPYQQPEGLTRPIADNMVAGWITKSKGQTVWFDYNRGAMGSTFSDFPQMPEEITNKTPMSLWNVALEVHTGRIFEKYIGSFYILYVPLAGICILIVLISGFFVWWLGYRKRTNGLKD